MPVLELMTLYQTLPPFVVGDHILIITLTADQRTRIGRGTSLSHLGVENIAPQGLYVCIVCVCSVYPYRGFFRGGRGGASAPP